MTTETAALVTRVVCSNNTWLPNQSNPIKSTIEINSIGKIIKIHDSIKPFSYFESSILAENYNDLGDIWLLPGVSY